MSVSHDLQEDIIMAIKIALAQSKGGSGKTTTTINLAGALHEKGYSVFVADLDVDKPDAFMWLEKNEVNTIDFDEIKKRDFKKRIEELDKEYEYIIMDTPPNLGDSAIQALSLSDYLIIPMQPSGMDYGHAMDTKELAGRLGIRSKFSINRYRKGTKDSKEILASFDHNGFKNYFTLLVDFVAAESKGLYIGNYKPNAKAHIEAQNFVNEVIEWVGGKNVSNRS